jgi:hypothetical protein
VTAPVGVWLVAGTPTSAPYPCRCRPGGDCSPVFCPCAGRMDAWNWPAGCCAWVTPPHVAAKAQAEYSTRRASYETR